MIRAADRLLPLAALSAAAAIMAGAFGAHRATVAAAELLRTGAQYQLIHALAALVVVGRSAGAARLFVGGGWLFAGSLYLLAAGVPREIGIVTPIGGVALIAGWLLLTFRLARG